MVIIEAQAKKLLAVSSKNDLADDLSKLKDAYGDLSTIELTRAKVCKPAVSNTKNIMVAAADAVLAIQRAAQNMQATR